MKKHTRLNRWSRNCSARAGLLSSLLCLPPVVTGPMLGQSVNNSSSQPEAAAAEPPTLNLQVPSHEISVSGDYLYGQGTIAVPYYFSVSAGPEGQDFVKQVISESRNSDYFGATLSFSLNRNWSFDISYANGSSAGDSSLPAFGGQGPGTDIPTRFTLDDNWYQGYVRYNLPELPVKNMAAYLRAGFSFIQADISNVSTGVDANKYRLEGQSDDILGNVGFGLLYSLYSGDRLRVGMQLEGEGFYGNRSQDVLETFQLSPNSPINPWVNIDNAVYGAIGRLTVRNQYELGKTGAWKLFADIGIAVKYTLVPYSGFDTFTEVLWGPYVKLGVRFSF